MVDLVESPDSPVTNPEIRSTTIERSTRDAATTAVVELVADVTDRTPLELDPLYETIDPETIEAITTSFATADASVTFSYAGCLVTVRADGTVAAVPDDR